VDIGFFLFLRLAPDIRQPFQQVIKKKAVSDNSEYGLFDSGNIKMVAEGTLYGQLVSLSSMPTKYV
jgi:hypothetical protein